MAKQKTNRKVFATTATAALAASVVAPAVTAADTTFPDIDQVTFDEAVDAINHLASNDILQGDDNGYFNPQDSIDRASAAEALQKAVSLPVEGTIDFSDVDVDDWEYDAVRAVTEAGIFEGNGNGGFDPDNSLTRQQAAMVVVEAYGLTGSEDSSFEDNDAIEDWAIDGVETAVANGIIEGKPDGTFAPTEDVDRQSFAVMIKRAIDATEATPEVESVSAINATTVEVTIDGVEEPVEIELDEALEDGATTVSFEYDGHTYTDVELDEAFNAEVEVESVNAIDATTLSVTFEGEDEAVEIELDEDDALSPNVTSEVTFTYDDVEYTEEVTFVDVTVQDLAFESTTSFDVTLGDEVDADANIDAVLESLEISVEIDGEEVTPEVTGYDLNKDGDVITIEHDNNDLLGANGTLSVNDVTVDFEFDEDAVDSAVTAVDDADDAETLLTALNTPVLNLENVHENLVENRGSGDDLVFGYIGEIADSFTNNVERIQAAIDRVNEDRMDEVEDALNTLNTTTSSNDFTSALATIEVELSTEVKGVNLIDYFDAVQDAQPTTVEEVEEVVESTELSIVEDAVNEALETLRTDDIGTAEGLIGELVEGDEAEAFTEQLDAIADGAAVNTALDSIQDDIDTLVSTEDNDIDSINDVTLEAIVDESESYDDVNELEAALEASFNAGEIELNDGIFQSDNSLAYLKDLDGEFTFSSEEEVESFLDRVNSEEAQEVIDAVNEANAATDGDDEEGGLYEALTNAINEIDGSVSVESANTDLYYTVFTNDELSFTSLSDIEDFVQYVNNIAEVNNATSVTISNDLLDFDNVNYSDLGSQSRTEVGALFLEANADTSFESEGEIVEATNVVIEEYKSLIAAVNNAETNSAMDAALEELDEAFDFGYDDLNNTQQLAVAEHLLDNPDTDDDDEEVVPYASFDDINDNLNTEAADTSAPELTNVSVPDTTVNGDNANSVDITVDSNETASIDGAITDEEGNAVEFSFSDDNNGETETYNASVDVSSLSDGELSLDISATDSSGNTGVNEDNTFELDTTDPVLNVLTFSTTLTQENDGVIIDEDNDVITVNFADGTTSYTDGVEAKFSETVDVDVTASNEELNSSLEGFFDEESFTNTGQVTVQATPGLTYSAAESYLNEDSVIGTLELTDDAENTTTYNIKFAKSSDEG